MVTLNSGIRFGVYSRESKAQRANEAHKLKIEQMTPENIKSALQELDTTLGRTERLLRGAIRSIAQEEGLIHQQGRTKAEIDILIRGVLANGDREQIKALDEACDTLMPNYEVPNDVADAIFKALG